MQLWLVGNYWLLVGEPTTSVLHNGDIYLVQVLCSHSCLGTAFSSKPGNHCCISLLTMTFALGSSLLHLFAVQCLVTQSRHVASCAC